MDNSDGSNGIHYFIIDTRHDTEFNSRFQGCAFLMMTWQVSSEGATSLTAFCLARFAADLLTGPSAAELVAEAPSIRGFNSSTYQFNVSAFCRIGVV